MITSPAKAIRAKCIDCCCGNAAEVRACEITDCALHPFRFGKNPYHKKRELTEEEKQQRAQNFLKAKFTLNPSIK